MARTREEWAAIRRERWSEAFKLVEEGKARPQVVEAVELAAQGYGISEIAEHLGISVSMAGQRLNDPTERKAHRRKRKRFGKCKGCGRRTYNSGSEPGEFCGPCWRNRNRDRNRAIMRLWRKGKTGEEIAAELGLTYNEVRGFINAERERNGVESSPRHAAPNRDHWDEIAKLWRQGLSSGEIAERVGLSYSKLVSSRVQAMRAAGFDLPYRAKSRA